jgi:hypothetical protein
LHAAITARIARSAADNGILKQSHLRKLLAFWYDWGDRETLKQWGTRVTDDPGLLAALLDAMRERPAGNVPPGQDPPPRFVDGEVDPDWLKYFIASDELARRAQRARETLGLSAAQCRGLDALLAVHEKRRRIEEATNPFESRQP